MKLVVYFQPKHLQLQHFQSQSGQSLVETLVISLALVPILFLGVWLGKLADIQLANGAAARQLAFDCVQQRAECKQLSSHPGLVDRARIQHMTAPGREVLSNDHLDSESASSMKNPLWTDRRGNPMIEDFSHVTAKVVDEKLHAPASHMANSNQKYVVDAIDHLSNIAGPGRFNLSLFGGFQVTTVQTKVSQSAPSLAAGERLDFIPLTLQRKVAILGDAWTSTGAENGRPDSTKVRVDQGAQLPFGSWTESALSWFYAGTRGAMTVMDAIGLEANTSGFKLHRYDPTAVPYDRTPDRTPPAKPALQPFQINPGDGD